MEDFKSNKRKIGYAYLLTPPGIAEKAVLTRLFLKRRAEEYELLKVDVELLQQEVFGK